MSSQASTTTASPTTNATGAPACICDIPSIDLRPYFEDKGVVIGHPATKDQLDVSRRINDACKEHGFVHVTNFGFTGTMARRMFDASKDLFDNPLKVNQYVPWSPSTNIGFSPYQNETLNTNRKPDLKEAFNLRFPPRWTKDMHKFESLPKSFQSMVNNIYQDDEHEKDGSDGNSLFSVFQLIATRYAMACAVALGLSPTAFSKTLTNYNLCTVRFLHYPPTYMEHNDNSGDDDGTTSSSVAIRAGEHTDFGAFTFLFLGSQGPLGLQVKSVDGGEIGGSAGGENDDDGQGVRWKDVVIPSSDGQDDDDFGAVINTGAMLARWTNDHWKATAHRVVVPDEDAARKDRYSIAFFVDPDVDQLIEVDDRFKRTITDSESTSGVDSRPFAYEPITSQDFIHMKLRELADGAKRNK